MTGGRASAALAPACAAHICLKRSVRAVRVGEDVVLLDIKGDRYLCLPAAGSQAQLAPDGRTLRLAAQLAESLPASLLAPGLEPAPAPPELPLSDLSASPAPRITLRDWLRLALCYLDYWRVFAGRPFARILAGVRRAPRPPARACAATQAAAVFARLVLWLPVSGQCLVRSFLLMRFILRSGAEAQWVFGVRTWPFGAHCWVQADGVVLDDYAGTVAGYAPVMAV